MISLSASTFLMKHLNKIVLNRADVVAFILIESKKNLIFSSVIFPLSVRIFAFANWTSKSFNKVSLLDGVFASVSETILFSIALMQFCTFFFASAMRFLIDDNSISSAVSCCSNIACLVMLLQFFVGQKLMGKRRDAEC